MTSAALAVEDLPLADCDQREATSRKRLEQMFRSHHQLIWRTLRRTGLSADLASDTTQQAYLIAAERLENIRSGCERAFLFSTAIGLARTQYRRNKRCKLEGDMDLHLDPVGPVEQATNRCRALELMDRVFARMDTDLVTVFTLFELEGLSAPEISGLLDIPVGTVASRLRRARGNFRAAARRMEVTCRGGATS